MFRFGYVEQDTEISFKMPTQMAADKIQKENVPPQPKSPTASEKTAVLSTMQQNNVSPAVSAVSAASTSPSKEEVDDRETNRRSPNGFLLPDPLPKGELLIDSAKQVRRTFLYLSYLSSERRQTDNDYRKEYV